MILSVAAETLRLRGFRIGKKQGEKVGFLGKKGLGCCTSPSAKDTNPSLSFTIFFSYMFLGIIPMFPSCFQHSKVLLKVK